MPDATITNAITNEFHAATFMIYHRIREHRPPKS
jgi:hypothetical protein